VFTYNFSTENTTLKYSSKNGKLPYCFSWKVIALCEGVNGSSQSEKQCLKYSGPKIAGDRATNEIDKSSPELNIFPNPTNSTATVMVQNPTDLDFVMNVYNMQGRLIQSEKSNFDSQDLTISKEVGNNLNTGIYIIQIVSENLNISKKLIIQ